MSQDTIEGYVDHIIFRNEDNGYTVLNLIVKGSEVICVGTFEYVGEGELLELHGFYVEHATGNGQPILKELQIKTMHKKKLLILVLVLAFLPFAIPIVCAFVIEDVSAVGVNVFASFVLPYSSVHRLEHRRTQLQR